MRPKKEKNIFERVLTRENLFFTCCIFLFIAFNKSLCDLYDDKIIAPFLSNFEGSKSLDILFFAFTAFTLLIHFYLLVQDKKISNTFFFFSCVLFGIFVYSYFFSNKYYFISLELFPNLKYADSIFLLFGIIGSLKVLNWISPNQKPFDNKDPFLIDSPIVKAEDDLFTRKKFAKKIAIKIQSELKPIPKFNNKQTPKNDNEENSNFDYYGSLAIGINGEWGSGKTSFTNMIKEYINSENRIVIDFHPWRSSTQAKIIEDFFELLIDKLGDNNPQLSNTISRYSKTLTKIDENIFSKGVASILELIFPTPNKNELYELINTSIEKSKKQVIVFIDDLDRLDKKEIIEVLRIVRNTASFNNIVYVVSYDKGYVLEAIKDFNPNNYKSFLEKIFQFEFALPMLKEGLLRTILKDILKDKLDKKLHNQIDRVVDSSEFHNLNFTNEFIKTHRDVIRFTNSLLFDLEDVIENIYFYDFYLLQLLKLKYQAVYDSILTKKELFFVQEIDSNRNLFFDLRNEDDKYLSSQMLAISKSIGNSTSSTERKEKSLKVYLHKEFPLLDLSEHEKNIIFYLIETLITEKVDKKTDGISKLNLFRYPSNFHKYFSFQLNDDDISSEDFELYRKSDFGSYKTKVLEWINENKYSSLKDKLKKIDNFDTQTEYENHVKLLFEIPKLVEAENTYYYKDENELSDLLVLSDKQIKKLYNSVDDYYQFIIFFFSNASNSPILESNVIRNLIERYPLIDGLKKNLVKINFNYLKEYCMNSNKISNELYFFYWNCVDENSTLSITSMNKEAELYFRDFVKKVINPCELGMYIRQKNPNENFYNLDIDAIQVIFPNGYDELEEFVNAKFPIDDPCFAEYNRFNDILKSGKNKEFKFERLKPIMWFDK